MNSWWKTLAGDYVNSSAIGALTITGSASTWRLTAFFVGDPTGYDLAGSWATEAAAEEAARQLVQGFDPSVLN